MATPGERGNAGSPPGGSPSNGSEVASLDLVSVLQDIKGELRRLSDEVNTMKSNPALRSSVSGIQHMSSVSEDMHRGSQMSTESLAAAANLANIMSDHERASRRRSMGTRESGATPAGAGAGGAALSMSAFASFTDAASAPTCGAMDAILRTASIRSGRSAVAVWMVRPPLHLTTHTPRVLPGSAQALAH